jgi:D-tyrosyl-tRNA(Tyr) deacylase
MIGLLQRVLSASVAVDGTVTAQIGPGLLLLIGVRPDDDLAHAERLIVKILKYRVFADDAGKMNLSLGQVDGELLLVPQFTLAADTRHGLRPGFSTAASPAKARALFDSATQIARTHYHSVKTGVFGAHMQVSLVNDGPVTLWLES